MKIGDTVRLKPNRYKISVNNPLNCLGKVIRIDNDYTFNYQIEWETGSILWYCYSDLDLVEEHRENDLNSVKVTDIIKLKDIKSNCTHPNKYINGLFTKFWVCSDCGKDLGDV